MPIKIPTDLPAKKVLNSENIFVMTETRAGKQDIRPLKILLLNLMPKKIETETQLCRLLGNTPLQVELELVMMSTHVARNTSQDHMLAFYKTFPEIKDKNFDGMIITGAPVEQMPFEEVEYWDELCEIMEWSKTHVHTYERNVIKEPTCTSRGIVSFSCSCGEEYTQSIAAAGHNVVWVYESRPTIYSTGSKYKSCSVCNEKLSAMTTVAKSTGGVNGDGKINSMDALAILQQAIGSRNSIINETDFLNADVNGDGVLNSMDALTILKISTGGIKL